MIEMWVDTCIWINKVTRNTKLIVRKLDELLWEGVKLELPKQEQEVMYKG